MEIVTEFLTSEALQQQDEVVIKGICNQGEIRLGLAFTEIEIENEKNVKYISLPVVKIIAYRISLSQLPSGMSGELHFEKNSSIDVNLLKHGNMLRAFS